jgi:hypothetical protein
MGRFWGLERAKADKIARNGERAALSCLVKTISCADRINYEPRGRGFKFCRARQSRLRLGTSPSFILSSIPKASPNLA